VWHMQLGKTAICKEHAVTWGAADALVDKRSMPSAADIQHSNATDAGGVVKLVRTAPPSQYANDLQTICTQVCPSIAKQAYGASQPHPEKSPGLASLS
jgi:hypothetical protein